MWRSSSSQVTSLINPCVRLSKTAFQKKAFHLYLLSTSPLKRKWMRSKRTVSVYTCTQTVSSLLKSNFWLQMCRYCDTLFIIELLMLKLCYRTQTMFSSCKVADVMIGSGWQHQLNVWNVDGAIVSAAWWTRRAERQTQTDIDGASLGKAELGTATEGLVTDRLFLPAWLL